MARQGPYSGTFAVYHTFHTTEASAANGTAISCAGLAGVGVQLEGISGETITFEGTIDGSTWYAVRAVNRNDDSVGTTATADGLYFANVAGMDQFRARISTADGGSVTATGYGVTIAGRMTAAETAVLSAPTDGTYIGDIKFGEALPANAGVDTGDVGVKSYTTVATGELIGVTAATQLPSVACKMVNIKACNDNAGNVYIGGSGVTVANGATDTTTGLQLDAGEETGWLTVDNLDTFYRIADNVGDDLTYLCLS